MPKSGRTPRQRAALRSSPADGIRASVQARIDRWLEVALGRMDDQELTRLVAAHSPAETMAEILAASSMEAAPSDWTELLLRGAEAKQEIAERAGGLLSSSEAARVAGITVAGIKQRLERRKLLAVPLSGGQWGFPSRQFEPDGQVRPGLAEVLVASGGIHPWTLLSILIDEPEQGGGETLLEALDRPEVRADVLARLASYGEQSAS